MTILPYVSQKDWPSNTPYRGRGYQMSHSLPPNPLPTMPPNGNTGVVPPPSPNMHPSSSTSSSLGNFQFPTGSGDFQWPTGGLFPQSGSGTTPTAPNNPAPTGTTPTGTAPTGTTNAPAPMPTMPQAPQQIQSQMPVAAQTPYLAPYAVSQNTNVGNVNGVDAVNVKPTSLSGYQPFIDAAYQQSTSRLDPQFEQADRKFQQQMVNQGISPGSQAYDEARGNFDRNRTDAYASARNDAMGQGLTAQGQAFGQGAQQAGLAQGMRQWSDQYGLNRDAADLNAYGTIAGIDMAGYGLNQNAQQQQWNNNQQLLGMIPGMAPQQIDVNNIYGLQSQNAQANAANAAASSNGMWGAIGQGISGYFSCSHDYKDTHESVDVFAALKAMCDMPVDMWSYIEGEDKDEHISTYAEEFHEKLGLPARKEIALIDMMGAVHASIQALNARLDTLESK